MQQTIVFRGIELNEAAHRVRYNVAELAAVCGVSVAVLRAYIKQATGVSPKRWMTMLFVERVTELVLEGSSVAKAAEIMGFLDLGHFSRAFSVARGFPPSDIQWKAEQDKNPVMNTPGRNRIRVAFIERKDASNLSNQLGNTALLECVAVIPPGGSVLKKIPELDPHLVVFDTGLAPRNKVTTVQALKSRKPQIKIVVTTSSPAAPKVEEFLRAGADGYLVTPASTGQCLATICFALAAPTFR